MAVDLPAQKHLPPGPEDNRRAAANERNRNSGGESAAGFTSSPSQQRVKFQQVDKHEQGEQKHGANAKREDEEVAAPIQEEQNEEAQGNAGDTVEINRREYALVKLSDIRKEVQCPICLGIIRKTRTVMECLHRFCRECIDKSMRLGNNECPACRTHCSSRRSLRDDPNYDSIIAVLYPNIDRYEEEELTLHEEDMERNKKIQTSIAETYQRQSEAVGKKRTLARRQSALPNRSRSRNIVPPDEDDHHHHASSADESSPDHRQKRHRRLGNEIPPDLADSSAASREVFVWGKNGARSQIRHGSTATNPKSTRITRIVDFLRDSQKNDDEFDVHLTLLPEQGEVLPPLPRPHLFCRSTVSIQHLRQFIALHTPIKDGDLEILVNPPEEPGDRKKHRVAGADETLAGLLDGSDLVLVYRLKSG